MKKQDVSPPDHRREVSRRSRLVATSVGVTALLAVGGVGWASGQTNSAGSTAVRPVSATGAPAQPGAQPGMALTETSQPGTANMDAAGSGTTNVAGKPAAGAAEPAPAAGTAPAASGPPETNPAPVQRKGKSDEELGAIAQPTAAPVDLTVKKAIKGGVSAVITEMTAVQGVATGVGEVAGPAVRFKVTVVNDTAAPLSLDRAVVDVSSGKDDAPANQLSGPDPVAFPATVAPGAIGIGVFVFAVPLDARDKVKIHFNLEAETPVATFAGRGPAGKNP